MDKERAELARRNAEGRRWSLSEMARLEEDLAARRLAQHALPADWVYRRRHHRIVAHARESTVWHSGTHDQARRPHRSQT